MLTGAKVDGLEGCLQGRKSTACILGSILLLALILRVYPLENLNGGSLGPAETITMADAASPFLHRISSVDQGPLKYYFLHAVLYFGRSEFLLVLPSLFFDLASILLLFYLGTLLFDRKTALWACFLWLFHHGIFTMRQMLEIILFIIFQCWLAPSFYTAP